MTAPRPVPAEDLLDMAVRALTTAGMPEDDARRVADVLVLADLFGIHTHGVSRIAEYLGRVRLGGIDIAAAVTVERVAPALARVDAANGVGPLAGSRALDAALHGANEVGIGAAFVRRSNHFGPVMPYLFQAAERGFAAIIASNATTTIAPWGGRQARLGNNPLGIGMPAPSGDHMLLDVAMSVAARAKIRAAAAAGQPIPDTWATDDGGRPTTDPNEALNGFLLPFGGHKGYGLSLMVDVFAGVLSGASYLTHISSWSEDPGRAQDLGHVFVLIDVAKVMPPQLLDDRMTDFAGIVHDTPPADPAAPVRLPGELELARYRRQLRDGVTVDRDIVARLEELAGAAR
jgi:LDH2 family malate/lactate/ureidoglycolate dehydrogenase